MWFVKKVTLFKDKDRETWQKIREVLKASGFKGVRASHYPIESLNACGCGAKVDPRNFGAGGTIDRHVYFVDVRAEDIDEARNVLSQNGITPNINEDPWGKLGRI